MSINQYSVCMEKVKWLMSNNRDCRCIRKRCKNHDDEELQINSNSVLTQPGQQEQSVNTSEICSANKLVCHTMTFLGIRSHSTAQSVVWLSLARQSTGVINLLGFVFTHNLPFEHHRGGMIWVILGRGCGWTFFCICYPNVKLFWSHPSNADQSLVNYLCFLFLQDTGQLVSSPPNDPYVENYLN